VAIDVPANVLGLLNRIQDGIAERLAPLEELGVYLRVQPTSESGQPVPRGMVQMFYVGSKFTVPGDGETFQRRELQFLLSLYLRDLRTHSDIYPVEQAIWALLTNWSPDECQYPGLLYPIESQLRPERNDAGYWISDLVVGMQIQHEGT
jgi:hypothetical protein